MVGGGPTFLRSLRYFESGSEPQVDPPKLTSRISPELQLQTPNIAVHNAQLLRTPESVSFITNASNLIRS